MRHPKGSALPAVCLIFCLFMFFAGCGPKWGLKGDDLSAEHVSSCMQQPLKTLGAYECERCVSLLERFLELHPLDPLAERAAIQLGWLYMNRQDFSAAYHLFLLFPDKYPESGQQQRLLTRLYLGICLYYMDKTEESLSILHPLTGDPEAAVFVRDVFRYLAENYVKHENLEMALSWYEKCDEAMTGGEDQAGLRNRVLQVMSLDWEPEALERVSILFPEGFFADAVQLGFAAAASRNNQFRLAEKYFDKLSEKHTDDLFVPHLQALRGYSSSDDKTRVCTVGCLLPLTGKYGRFGAHVLDALLLGARAFQEADEEGFSVRLLIRDTRGDPAVAVQQLRELAENQSVVGIIGPLLAGPGHACALEAQALEIPLITLTHREDVARVGDYIFQNGLTIRQQVDTLVEYAMEDLGISSFAVLFPADDYGTLARDVFADKLFEMGGDMVATASYQADETDFQDEIRLLLGEEYWLEMKRREREKKEEAVLLKKKEALSGLEEDSEFLEPASEDELAVEEEDLEEPLLPPFEALFIPDHYKKVTLIAPYLAFYDLNDVFLLGTSAWNSPHLVERAGDYVRDSVFVDGFFAESRMPHVKDFVEQFQREFQREPRVLEAHGYDSLMMLEEACYQAASKTRGKVREALLSITGYPGLAGYTRFDENGCATKRLYLLSVMGNRIEEIY